MRKALVLASALAGCHGGIGPVAAYSPQNGFRAGWEASGGFAFVRGSIGQTWAPSDERAHRAYLTFDPGYANDIAHQHLSDFSRVELLGGGATIGKAWGGEDGLAIGAWASGAMYRDYYDDGCNNWYTTYSVAVGYRVLGGIGELFIAPKVGTFNDPLSCLTR